MRVGCFEVQLLGADDVPFPERMIPTDILPVNANHRRHSTTGTSSSSHNDYVAVEVAERPIVSAVPDEEYTVKIIIHRLPNGRFPKKYVMIHLLIDGTSVNYTRSIELAEYVGLDSASIVFDGIRRGYNEMETFVFSTPVSIDSKQSVANQRQQLNSLQLGTIKVEIYEAYMSGSLPPPVLQAAQQLPQQSAVVAEGKKFWQQASVATKAGRSKNKLQFTPKCTLKKVKEPMQVMELQYHTKEMADFLANFNQGATTTAATAAVTNTATSSTASASTAADIYDAGTVDVIGSSSGSSSSSGEVSEKKRKSCEVVDLTGDDDVNAEKRHSAAATTTASTSSTTAATTAAIADAAIAAAIAKAAADVEVASEVRIDEEVTVLFRPKPKPTVISLL